MHNSEGGKAEELFKRKASLGVWNKWGEKTLESLNLQSRYKHYDFEPILESWMYSFAVMNLVNNTGIQGS